MIGRVVAVGYVATAATLGAVGFATDSSTPILVAGALTLPASIPAVVTFYAAYGLLALVPGANPSTGTGTGSCTADGVCQSSVTGEPASWFLVTTDVLGVLALTAAAVGNVLLVRAASSGRARTRSGA